MKKILSDSLTGTILLFVLLLMNSAASEQILDVNLNVYRNDSVTIESITVQEGNPTNYIIPGDYRIQITDANGSILFDKQIRMTFILLVDPPIEMENNLLALRIPYKKSMTRINLFNKQKQIFSKDFNLCDNNSVCDADYESYLTCPNDCAIDKDGLCTPLVDGVCDTDCAPGTDIDCGGVSTTTITTTTTTSTEEQVTTTTKPTVSECGDGVCSVELGENRGSCPEDCASGGVDKYCDKISDGVCDSDCSGGGDVDCAKSQNLTDYLPYILVLVVLIVVAFFAFKFYQRIQEKKIEKEREEFLKWKELQEKERTKV